MKNSAGVTKDQKSFKASIDATLKALLQNKCVLVVDDCVDNLMLVRALLSRYGLPILTADSGKKALEICEKQTPDLIFMDIQMPELDGYATALELRARGFSNPIIALTAHAMPDQKVRCLEMGFNEHLSKPVGSSQLVETIRTYF